LPASLRVQTFLPFTHFGGAGMFCGQSLG
jgi:hypothetical protein